MQTALFREHCETVRARYPELPFRRLVHETVRRMINALITDLVEESAKLIEAARPASIDAVRAHGAPLIAFSAGMAARNTELQRFLHQRLYEHERVQEMSAEAARKVRTLFKAYFSDPKQMPAEFATRAAQEEAQKGPTGRARIVADYVAGMTDRYATRESQRVSAAAA
jgi:dGTPase